MSINPESNGSVALEHRIEEVEPTPPEPETLVSPLASRLGPARVAFPSVVPDVLPAEPIGPTVRRRSRGWVLPAALAAVGLIASGTLGYFAYATTGQRDSARHQLAAPQATPATPQAGLSAAP